MAKKQKNALQQHKTSDKIKWIITFIAIILLFVSTAAIAVQFLPVHKEESVNSGDNNTAEYSTVFDYYVYPDGNGGPDILLSDLISGNDNAIIKYVSQFNDDVYINLHLLDGDRLNFEVSGTTGDAMRTPLPLDGSLGVYYDFDNHIVTFNLREYVTNGSRIGFIVVTSDFYPGTTINIDF